MTIEQLTYHVNSVDSGERMKHSVSQIVGSVPQVGRDAMLKGVRMTSGNWYRYTMFIYILASGRCEIFSLPIGGARQEITEKQ